LNTFNPNVSHHKRLNGKRLPGAKREGSHSKETTGKMLGEKRGT
jgi:hypothetical protein